jgi:hypothetical protein
MIVISHESKESGGVLQAQITTDTGLCEEGKALARIKRFCKVKTWGKHVTYEYMPTPLQRQSAQKNIRKAQAKWKSMSPKQRSLAQPEGKSRQRPGAGGGKFYRIEVRSKTDFVTFRTQDIGEPGHVERIAGKRSSGSWDTVTWLIAKNDAHLDGGKLIIDDPKSKTILKQIEGPITHKKSDVFRARPRKNTPKRKTGAKT